MEKDKIEADLQKIALHYGFQHQLIKLAEEASELSAAAIRFAQSDDCEHRTDIEIAQGQSVDLFDNVIEEAADVLVMLSQISFLTGCEKMLETVAERKIARQIERIRAEEERK